MPEVNALPMVCDSERLAANWMVFVATRGRAGLQKAQSALGQKRLVRLLSAGPGAAAALLDDPADDRRAADWLTFLFPP